MMKKHSCKLCGRVLTCGNKEKIEKVIYEHLWHCKGNEGRKIGYNKYKEK